MMSKNDDRIVIIHLTDKNTTNNRNTQVRRSERNRPRSYTPIPSDAIQLRESDNTILINGIIANVDSYKILVPDRVVQVKFIDGSFEKVVLQDGDIFDLDTAIRICIAKHVGRRYYNLSGIEDLTRRLSYLKCIDKMILKVHKKMNAEKKSQAMKEKIKRDNAEIAEHRRRRSENMKGGRVNESKVTPYVNLDTNNCIECCSITSNPTKNVENPKSSSKGHLNIRTERHTKRRNK